MVRIEKMFGILISIMFIISMMLIVGCDSEPKNTGGVIICGSNFPCGAEDSVCPEDYNATCHVKDIDCENKKELK